MTICPACEKPIKSGQAVRGQFICDFNEEPTGITHGIRIISEEWLEHEVCQYENEGD